MILREYLELRNGTKSLNSLSNKELKYLDITQGKKGWLSEHHNRELEVGEVIHLTKLVLSSLYIKPCIKNNVKDLLLTEAKDYDKQFVYLMKSSNGLYKIGISLNPEKRAKSLSGASGFKVSLLGYWKVKGQARQVEKYLHDKFSAHRGVGEWFTFTSGFDLLSIEQELPCEHMRVLG